MTGPSGMSDTSRRMGSRKLAFVTALSVLLALLPGWLDLAFAGRYPDAGRLLARPTLPPIQLFGVFQLVELVLVASWLMAIRRHPFRLAMALAVLALAAIGFMVETCFRALRPQSFYGSMTAPLEWVAAASTILAVAFAALGNLAVRRPRLAYAAPTALLVGSAAGALLVPLLAAGDARVHVLEVGSYVSRRFSASELGWLLAAAWTTHLYARDRAGTWLAWAFGAAVRRRTRQLGLAEAYRRTVRVGDVEVVDRAWEANVRGSGLGVRREGRRYVGVPTPEAARWRLARLGLRMARLRLASAVATAAALAMLVLRALA